MSPTPQKEPTLKTTTFKSTGDWINTIIADNCHSTTPGREGVAAVKDDKGKVTTSAVRATQPKSELDMDKFGDLCEQNGITLKSTYAAGANEGKPMNAGMIRMNATNSLRAKARRQGGLILPDPDWNGDSGEPDWVEVEAPKDFMDGKEPTHNFDGSKIAQAKAVTPSDEDKKAPADSSDAA